MMRMVRRAMDGLLKIYWIDGTWRQPTGVANLWHFRKCHSNEGKT